MSDLNGTNGVPSNQEEPIRYLRLGDLELWILPDTFVLQEASLFALEAAEHEIERCGRNEAEQSGYGDYAMGVRYS
jgi:hypothetical protein